jgi:hypothetical protein
MRFRRSEPLDAADGVRTRVELADGPCWVDAPTAVTAEAVEAELLRQSRESAFATIAQSAEGRRSAITAAAPGKQGAYLLKYELVLRAESGTDDTAKNQLTTEATVRGLTYEQLRDVIITKRAAWEAAAMAIETVEAFSKAEVAAAVDRASVDAAVADARQQLAGIGG